MQKRSEEYIQRVVDMYNSGLEAKEIAEKEGKNPRTIQDILRKANVTRRSRKGETRVDKEYLEKIKSLYEEGKTAEEIGKILGKSGKTIGFHLKKLGIQPRSSKSITEDQYPELIDLFESGYSDEQLAEYFNCSIPTVRRHRGILNLKQQRYFSQLDVSLTEEQEQMILGSLLGDLNLSHPQSNRHNNSRLTIVHSVKQKALFMKKVEILGEFMGAYRLETPSPDSRTGNVYQTYRGNSYSHPIFTNIYDILYINKVKTVTGEYLSKIYHPIALAYWFMDDGSSNGTIATCSFTLQECSLLSKWLLTKFNIETTIRIVKDKNWNLLYIKEKSRKHFEELILPYIIPEMKYKLKYFN